MVESNKNGVCVCVCVYWARLLSMFKGSGRLCERGSLNIQGKQNNNISFLRRLGEYGVDSEHKWKDLQ